MKLVFIADLSSDISYGKIRIFQKVTGGIDAVAQNVFMGRYQYSIFKYFSKIAAVQVAPVCKLSHGYILIIVSFNVHHGFMDIKFLQVVNFWRFTCGGSPYQDFQNPIHGSQKGAEGES